MSPEKTLLMRPLPGHYADKARSESELLSEHIEHVDSEARLCTYARAVLARSGLMEALRPKVWGGAAAHPVDFFAGVIELSAALPSLGWVAGVMGVHQFEVAVAGEEVAQSVWGNADARGWVATPYAERGRAIPHGEGFQLSGTWEYSTGFELADWLCIGGRIDTGDGPGLGRVFVLPRSEALAIPNSWRVMGLRGTASLTFRVSGAYVPSTLVYDPGAAIEGSGLGAAAYEGALYRMPRQSMLGSAITAATLGAGLGYLRWFVAENGTRLKGTSRKAAVEDPIVLTAIAVAAADCEAGITALLSGLSGIYERAEARQHVDYGERLWFKRNCVNAVHRLGASLDQLFTMGGASGLRQDSIGQFFWRDFCAGRNHNSHVYEWFLRYGKRYYNIDYAGGVV